MDDLDRALVALLSADARISVATLGRRLKVARSTVQARLERLEGSGVIAGYTIRLGEAAQQNRIRATVLLELDPKAQAGILSRLKSFPEIERIHTTSGKVDLLLQIAAPSTSLLDAALDRIGELTGVRDLESLIHLTTKLDRAI